MCSLRFGNNFLTIEGVRFASIENTIIEAFLRFRFASVAITIQNVKYQTFVQVKLLNKLFILSFNSIKC